MVKIKKGETMWIFTNKSFLSVVADRNSKTNLLVRARVRGHIEAVFPDATVFTNNHADYFYRALIPRKQVEDSFAESARSIDYDNFKDSVADNTLHGTYFRVWQVMRTFQDKLLGGTCH